jgi:CBS-domain-containing membrane protein
MSVTVRDCMNPQLVYIREGDRADLALKWLLEFGITAVPVVDEEMSPVGTVSLRELADPKRTRDSVTTPAETIAIDSPISVAAQKLADANVHQLVVIDTDGHAAGMVSALDVVRGLLGLAAKHPKAIEAFERAQSRT